MNLRKICVYLSLAALLLFPTFISQAQHENTTFYQTTSYFEGDIVHPPAKLKKLVKDSYKSWKKESAKHNNSYKYTIRFSSWVGSGTITIVEVIGGLVQKRTIKHFADYKDKNGKEVVEYSDALNQYMYGAKGWTMDQWYQKCSKEYLQKDPKKHSLLLGLSKDNNYLIMCGSVHESCADDCFRGMDQIESFEWLD